MKTSAQIKNFINTVIRFINNFKRPSKQTNLRLLQNREETLSSFSIREATLADVPSLAALHVKTWNETYPNVKRPPTYEIREHQWHEQFKTNDGNWFCFVAVNKKSELIGFAKGKSYSSEDLPDYSGELNQIYVLKEYHRLGLGKRLVCKVAQRLLSKNIFSMVLFGIPQNPSSYFHEAMGGKKLYAKNGEFHGGYGWQDLRKLIPICSNSYSLKTPFE